MQRAASFVQIYDVMAAPQTLKDVIAKAESALGFRSISILKWKPGPCIHQDLTRHWFWKDDRDYNRHELNDDQFSQVSDWFEQEGWMATRQLRKKDSDKEWVHLSPLHRCELKVGFHATRTVTVPRILEEGLLPGNRVRSTSKMSDRCDQIGNCYVAENLGNPGDEANEIKGTVHWWREHKSHNNCFDDPAWSILRLDFDGLPDLRLYLDPWSHTGMILRSIIPAGEERIKQVV